MEYFTNSQGSLFKLTKGEYDFILDLIRVENPVVTEEQIDLYDKAAIQTRNHKMVDRADLLVCYVENNSGGAYQTVQY